MTEEALAALTLTVLPMSLKPASIILCSACLKQKAFQKMFSILPHLTTTVLGRHQLALSIAYDAILVPAATGSVQPFVNYVTDRGAYTTLNRLCQAIWALRQGDWSALGAEIPASVQVKLTDSTLGLRNRSKPTF